MDESVPLSSVPEGRDVRMVGLRGGRGFAMRLASMGLVPGVSLHVLKNRGQGPFVVGIRQMRIAIGRGMAHRIRVI